jgi:hypothetical protein
MKLQIEEAELRNLVHKVSRYDIIMDALIREKFDKIDIYSDVEMTDAYMQYILSQQPSDISPVDEDRIKADRDWMDKHPDFGIM